MKLSLSNFIKSATALFSMFGGFLKNVCPPVDNIAYVIGFAQVICLLVIILISYKKTKRVRKKLFKVALIFGITFLLVGLCYFYYLNKCTTDYNQIEIVKGNKLNTIALVFCGMDDLANTTPAQIALCEENAKASAASLGWEKTDVWTADSILFNEILLIVLYILLLSSMSICIFSLVDYYSSKKE